MPYVPAGFYVLAGPKPPVALEDQVTLPLPMDSLIQAQEEELMYSLEDREEETSSEPTEGQGEDTSEEQP